MQAFGSGVAVSCTTEPDRQSSSSRTGASMAAADGPLDISPRGVSSRNSNDAAFSPKSMVSPTTVAMSRGTFASRTKS